MDADCCTHAWWFSTSARSLYFMLDVRRGGKMCLSCSPVNPGLTAHLSEDLGAERGACDVEQVLTEHHRVRRMVEGTCL